MSKIVVVEDDEEIAYMIREKLEILGFEIFSCLRPSELMLLLKTTQPDCILLDIRLPEKSGIDIARELKNDKKTKNIPLIAVSGTSNIDDSQTFKAAGFSETCPKPINYTDLIMKIARVLSI